MKATQYPFAALIGQNELRLALLLSSVDWRLSVLLKGDKGSGKSTAARALADILPTGAPFINIPIGASEDRLLGGLDLGQALQGQANLKSGLIHEANGGVLYIDEINLLADNLTDALLDVAASGSHLVERDGFSSADRSHFILLGSMNIEEGQLRPQLLDRFALSLDVEAPLSIEERTNIIVARMQFDADPEAFCGDFEEQQQFFRKAIVEARSLVARIKPSSEIVRRISEAITENGVRSLRADLAAVRAAIAKAALSQRTEVIPEDVDAVMPLVLHHRSKKGSEQPPPITPPAKGSEKTAEERIFPLEPSYAAELTLKLDHTVARGRSALAKNNDAALDVAGSLKHSFRNTGQAVLKREHLLFKKPMVEGGIRFIFLVDASGSHAAHQRMSAVKGVIAALLDSSVDHKDEVAVVSFRGAKAEIVLEPCRDAEAALRVLEFLPTGGRTPLAHALELGETLVNANSLLILLTDGRANVPCGGSDAWSDALNAAAKIQCAAVLVDTSVDASNGQNTEELASKMDATLLALNDLTGDSLRRVLK